MIKTLPLNEALKTVDLPELDRNLFSSPEWLFAIYNTYKLKAFVKYIERDAKISSYIVYSVVRNFLEWKICICSFCDYCDCYVQNIDDWNLFFKSLREEYPEYRIAIRNLRDSFVKEIPELEVLSTEKFHLLDVSQNLDVIWKRAHDSFKAAVKQGERLGVTIRRCDKSELIEFYNLHLDVRKNKYRIFPQPYNFFVKIWEQFIDKDMGILLGAFDQKGRFIAGNVYLICGDTLYYKFNTSSKDALHLRPNNLLFWEGVKYAKERNLKFIDLGSSGNEQKGLILFKNHTGAKSQEITHYGFKPKGYKFSEKRILRLITSICTLPWVPNCVVRWGSGLIYPFLA